MTNCQHLIIRPLKFIKYVDSITTIIKDNLHLILSFYFIFLNVVTRFFLNVHLNIRVDIIEIN